MISQMPMPDTAISDAKAGASRNGSPRPMLVTAAASTSTELSDRPRRRPFTARDALRILAETDRAGKTGGMAPPASRGPLFVGPGRIINPRYLRSGGLPGPGARG
jgi:hypothetical protein